MKICIHGSSAFIDDILRTARRETTPMSFSRWTARHLQGVHAIATIQKEKQSLSDRWTARHLEGVHAIATTQREKRSLSDSSERPASTGYAVC